ncbi:sulfotransferase [Mesorhizobium sp.]|uniref:sulfotransferase family protein n=1 Tax=Mesorhizobium sp. TaxID=1871066 RepID=UPI000FE9E157|nr:sulfotransferase [Mesorhizobium sp.]RWM21650.1 MAG: sulfotransferase [Mesorhizobium sp.]RWM41048.1 MAG: sulfotransferase [Mesorhizobium sp.]TIO73768.1 MAG: sulfotransferase [Mesorhizobium sp.]TIO82924.1 MAG: sulfotransferase [Mesorhizobium sp.]TJV48718.1 MAG: sulfotransferase [Mesorhizobium sp.]
MLEQAASLTGLSDYGEPDFEEAFERLLYSAEHEAGFSETGEAIFRDDMIRLLSNRLLLLNDWNTKPDLATEDIERPMFIVGLPRSGTSILHELLAQDDENRVPLTWETTRLIAGSGEDGSDEEIIARAENEFHEMDKIIPDFKKIHRVGPMLPDECVGLMNNDFRSMHFHVSYRVPAFQEWLDRSDFTAVYRSHKRQLQRLQRRKRGVQWVLKSPQHLWTLDALLAVYPDARIVQLHRDPVDALASYASLVRNLRRAVSDSQDPHEIGREWARYFAVGLNRTMQVRQASEGKASFLEISYWDLVTDPLRVIERIYAHCGRRLSGKSAERMRSYLKAHPADMFGKHKYSLRDFGLDRDEEAERFRAYRQAFDVA